MRIALIFNNQIIETKTVNDTTQYFRKGWRLIEEDKPVFNSATHILVLDSIEILSDKVIEHYIAQASAVAVQKEAHRVFNEKIILGYVTGLGFNLGVQESDRSQFTQMLVLINSAQMAGFIDDSSIQTIADIDGELHDITTGQFKEIILGYGIYCKDLWDEMKQLMT
jgi:hypothetical protein